MIKLTKKELDEIIPEDQVIMIRDRYYLEITFNYGL